LEWVLGGAFALLGLLVAVEWLGRRDRTRAWLAASAVLLGLVALIDAIATATQSSSEVYTDVLLVLFVGSGWAFFEFRHNLIPVRRFVRVGVGVVVLLTIGYLLYAYVPAPGPAANPTPVETGAALALLVVWSGCVLEPIVRFWLLSRGLPVVQRSRLRSLTLAYGGIIAVLVLSVIGGLTGGSGGRLEVTTTVISLIVIPLFYMAYAPPRWLRRVWREREQEPFREALNDLLLHSPDRGTLARRAAEWATRLVGADAAVIAMDTGEVLAVHGIDRPGAVATDTNGEHIPAAGDAEQIVSADGSRPHNVIRVPLGTDLGHASLVVRAGPLTPVFGEDEAARLAEYGSMVTSALDRVILLERLRRNAELLDLAYDAILTWDVTTDTIAYWNKSAEAQYGFTAEEAIGTAPGELLDSELPEPRKQILQHLERTGAWEGEVRQTTKEGRRIIVSARWALQKDADGRPIAVLEINRDISAAKQAAEELVRARDEAERASQAKSEYLSRMSHELRTPLTAILGYSDLLELRVPREDQREAIAAVQRASEQLLSLVNDVLDIARIESGRERMVPESVSIAATIEECLRLVTPSAMERRIHLEADFGEHGYAYVRADRQRLAQALLNLLSNAVKYSGDGARVSVKVEQVGKRFRIAVVDTGPGLDDSQLERLFQPFERLGAERTTIQGTGLGLALTKKLIEAMDGEIGVESAPGRGTTFWIMLERATPSVEQQVEADRGAVATVRTGASRTVLYVEDNLATITLMEDIFAMRPQIRLITAMQGGLTLDLARQHQPDLIVLDLQLPDIGGDEVLRRLRRDARTAQIPVVMFSADATERQIKRLLAAGARAYLTKPAKVKEFLSTLDEVLATPPVAAK
jgi:PAS domain S-box-containing protein